MRTPARLLTLKSLPRRSPPLVRPSLHHFSTYSSPSFYSNSLLHTSIHHHHHHHHHRRRDYNPQISYHDSISFPRRFSMIPDFSASGEPFLPVRAVISLLESYQDVTGLPWWIIISSSTVAMRLAIFPLTVLQLKKLRRIGELLPTLPPPFPPPMSGRSYKDQISLFWTEKQAAGCPSFFWFFTSFAVQVPCFFLWLMSIRRMSLNHHPGFDSGGTLWFQNLTEFPNGSWGPIFPLLIAGLHYTNIEISFQKQSLKQLSGPLGLLTKCYRTYLQLLTLPIMYATFNVPQGSLVYWLTNSSLTLVQQLCLRNPYILEYLGLPKKEAPLIAPKSDIKISNSGEEDILILTKQGEISAKSLSPGELVSFSVKVLTDGHKDTAIKVLRFALEKDPGNVRALLMMGQTLLQKKELAEATDYLERAISKLLVAGHPASVEEVDLLILSSQWAGIANVQQEKMHEGLVHLQRIAELDEPEDSKSKAHYYDGLFLLSSVLLNTGHKDEASKYLHKAAAYNPAYSVYFKDLENDMVDDFASDLSSSRRGFK